MNIHKGDRVTYRPRFLDFDVSADVLRVHRDGTVTVRARFPLDDDGKEDGNWLGYTYRFDCKHINSADKIH